MQPVFKRVLIKLSGEILSNNNGGVGLNSCPHLLDEIKLLVDSGTQVAIVIGGGNIMRGGRSQLCDNIKRATADSMGMLATMINALALTDILESTGIKSVALSSRGIQGVIEASNFRNAQELLDKNNVVIFAGGTGNPFVTTDSTASLRACEIEADAIFKITTVAGVYNKDPNKYSDATIFKSITFNEVLDKQLAVMDLGAFIQCRDFNIPICVFSMDVPQNLVNAVNGQDIGTWIRN